jgi:hypothetical protein
LLDVSNGSTAVGWLDRAEPAKVTAGRSRSPSCRLRGCRSWSDEPSWNGRLVVTYESSIGSVRRRFGVAGALGVPGHDEWMRPHQPPSQRPAPSPPSRDDRGYCTCHPGNKFAAYIAGENGRVAARLRREHPTRNMTICRSIPAEVCLRRALRAQAASNRQTSPVRASWERPANGRKCLIARMFAALRSDRLRFLACFSGVNRGETGALVPLFAACVGVISSTIWTKLAGVERGVSLPFRLSGKNFPCRRSLVTVPLGHQPSGRYGRIANEPGSARCPFANLPCRQGKLGKAVGGRCLGGR